MDNNSTQEVQKFLDQELDFEDVIGNGSFGCVVRAKCRKTNECYAVKMLFIFVKEKHRTRELNALTTQGMTSPNILKYLDAWKANVDGKYITCIQTELCYSNLGLYRRETIKAQPKLIKNGQFYKHVFPQILKGLDVLHSFGWVHRDLHTDNILIGNPEPKTIQDSVVKIADFGLARNIGNLTSKSELDKLTEGVGNRFIRAPEMSKNEYDHKVDLYSAGILLYFLFCSPTTDKTGETEIVWLRENGGQNVDHKDKMAVKLLRDLLKTDPKERPTAREALARFENPESSSSKSTVKFRFRLKHDPESQYDRLSPSDISFSEIKNEINSVHSIPQENQKITQEVQENGRTIKMNIDSDHDFKNMMKSSDEKGSNTCSYIYLEVSNKKDVLLPNEHEEVPMEMS